MIELNGQQYRLCSIDTGVLSEMLKNPSREMRKFVEHSTGTKTFPSISIFTVLELRKRTDLYKRFLAFFSLYPFLLLKTPDHLFRDELKAYPDPSSVSPVAYAFSPLNRGRDAQLRKFMKRLFSSPEVKKAEREWDRWKPEVLESILRLKENFSPQGKRYKAADAARFIEYGIPQHVISRKMTWARRRVDAGDTIDPHAFPSLKLAFYTVFLRFYAEEREPEPQDTFDILIAASTPYVDQVLTEKFQAEILRKVKKRDDFLRDVEVGTIRDLR